MSVLNAILSLQPEGEIWRFSVHGQPSNETEFNDLVIWEDGVSKCNWSQVSAALPQIETKILAAETIGVNQQEAGVRIATLFGESDPEKLKLKQLNALARMGELLEAKIDGTSTTEEANELAALKSLNNQKNAIRQAENDAAVLINAANTEAEVNSITVNWP